MYPEVSGSSRGSCFRQYSGAMLGFSKDQTRMTNRNRKGVVGMLPNANFQCSVTSPSKFQWFGDTSWGDWWRIWNGSTVWVMGRHIPNQTWNTSVATCRGHEQWLSSQQFGTCSVFFTPSNRSLQTHKQSDEYFWIQGMLLHRALARAWSLQTGLTNIPTKGYRVLSHNHQCARFCYVYP